VKDLSKKVYVGNLSFNATEAGVSEMMAEYGKVDSMAWITDRDSGRFRGFCFVEMEESAANAAIKALNDKDLDGRMLRVNEARPREDRGGNGGRQGGGGRYPHSGGGNF
jgi:RNA recognition motif-containing protein